MSPHPIEDTTVTFCTNCGTPATDAPFCTGCGSRLPQVDEATRIWAPPPVEPPVVQQTPEPVAKGPRRTALIVSLVVLILLGGGAAGVALWMQQEDSDLSTTVTSKRSAESQEPEELGSTSSPTEQAEPSPAPEPTVRAKCPDGALIPAGTNCRVDTAAAAMAAFGIEPSRCRASTAGSDHVGAVNLICLGNQVHIAIYESPRKRLQRLGDYGLGSGGCASEPGGIILCGPTKNGRWVRTYADGTGILLYASVEAEGYSILNELDQLTATELLGGSVDW